MSETKFNSRRRMGDRLLLRIQAAEEAANNRPTYNPKTIADLRAEARRIQDRLYQLYIETLSTIDLYIYDMPTTRLFCDISKEVAELNEQLEMLLAELQRRRI